MRRVRVLYADLERGGKPRRRRARRRVESRRGRRARPARASDVRRLGGAPPQGVHRGRGPHVDPRGLEHAPQDSRGAAASRRVRVRDHGAAEDRAERHADPVAPAALRLPAHRPARDRRAPEAGARRRRARGGGRRPAAHREERGRRDARRPLAPRPGALLRRGARHRRARPRRSRPDSRRDLRRAAAARRGAGRARRLSAGGSPRGCGSGPGRVRERGGGDAARSPARRAGWSAGRPH